MDVTFVQFVIITSFIGNYKVAFYWNREAYTIAVPADGWSSWSCWFRL